MPLITIDPKHQQTTSPRDKFKAMIELIKGTRERIMKHQQTHGFETIYDLINEDLDELERLAKDSDDIHIVSNRFTEPTNKHEPIIIEIYKEHLVELYNFAYKQALKTGKVDELKEIDRKINGC